MTSHASKDATGPGSPFFPTPNAASTPPTAQTAPPNLKGRVTAVAGLDHAHLSGANTAEIERTLESLLGALKNVSDAKLQAGERHGDGSLRITSHLAVWLIGKVADAYGAKLVRLSQVSNRESLRSISGLAVLLNAAISKQQGVGTQ